MTNTGKALIIGLVVVDLGFVGYLLFPKDERATAVTGAVVTSSDTVGAPSSRSAETHVVAGSVEPTAPPQAPSQIATAPQPHKQPARPRESANSRESFNAKTNSHESVNARTNSRESLSARASPAQKTDHARDDLSRHGSNPVAAAMTQALVRESAKPDPSLPLPPPSASPPTMSTRDGQDHRGSNPVAAAMTQALVRQSARVEPASQPPAR